MNEFRITVASLPDRENLVAEILYNGIQWAEISQENLEKLVVQFYSHPKQDCWEFPLDQALEALQEAKNRLLALGGMRE